MHDVGIVNRRQEAVNSLTRYSHANAKSRRARAGEKERFAEFRGRTKNNGAPVVWTEAPS